jgi:hypothetical protein
MLISVRKRTAHEAFPPFASNVSTNRDAMKPLHRNVSQDEYSAYGQFLSICGDHGK